MSIIEPIRIVKHVHSISSGQKFAVISRMPAFKFTRRDDLLLAEDSGFYSCYKYCTPGKYSRAFAGREFKIPMSDGSMIEANGQWWQALHPAHKDNRLLDYGIETEENLKKCFVFCSALFDAKLLETCSYPSVEYWDLERQWRLP